MGEPSVLASGIQLDGRARAVPGFEAGGNKGDACMIPHIITTTVLDFFDGSVFETIAPFDYEVIGAKLFITATLGSATSTIIAGTAADTDHFVESTTVPTTAATKAAPIEVDLTLTATLTGSAGDVITVTSGNGATTTGNGFLQLFLIPRN